jgi:hypothetical protein
MSRPTLKDATRAFGRPSSCTNGRTGPAVARWPSLRLVIHFESLPLGSRRCSDPAAWVLMESRRFVTESGLRVGDALGRLRQLYPGARAHKGLWWLTTAFDGLSGGDTPTLWAGLTNGRVAFIAAGIWAGGE